MMGRGVFGKLLLALATTGAACSSESAHDEGAVARVGRALHVAGHPAGQPPLDGGALEPPRLPDAAVLPDAAAGVLCGDGVRQPGEACDDGNELDGDGCSHACVVETCADGTLNNGELDVDCGGPCPACHDGWLTYVSTQSGTAEVWLLSDDGRRQVRVTEGMTNYVSEPDSAWRLQTPTLSWDGRHIALSGPRQPGGGFAGNSQIWIVGSDGSTPRRIARNGVAFRFSWSGDSRHLYYSPHVTCSEDILRIDALTPGASAQLIYGFSGIASDPAVNPANDNLILFNRQFCAQVGYLWRLDADTGITSNLGVDAAAARSKSWSHDGTRFVFRDGARNLVVHDGQAPVLTIGVGDALGTPAFGNDDEVLYAYRQLAEGPRIVPHHLTDGGAPGAPLDLEPLGDVTLHLSWARLPFDPDVDGDGVADGLAQ